MSRSRLNAIEKKLGVPASGGCPGGAHRKMLEYEIFTGEGWRRFGTDDELTPGEPPPLPDPPPCELCGERHWSPETRAGVFITAIEVRTITRQD
jgi:hypothetical protein